MNLTLKEAAAMLGVPYAGTDATVLRVSTDSRNIRPGDLFIALRGEKFDGGAFAARVSRAFQGVAAAPDDHRVAHVTHRSQRVAALFECRLCLR
jgi:UDP-N-acetylmuramoyl-tripeptide--D-alanyl-D-alanine ligase